MNKYVEHIEELLYLHDCVIVPGFGGFICDYTSASINEKTGTIVPPSKKVMFNKHLKQNDGLLIDWIARKEQIDYEKAQRRLALFCEEIKVRLNQKQKVDFGTIGTFSVDRRFNVLFESKNHNFLPDVIGMESLPLVTINGKKIRKTQDELINTESGNLVTRLFKFGLSAGGRGRNRGDLPTGHIPRRRNDEHDKHTTLPGEKQNNHRGSPCRDLSEL